MNNPERIPLLVSDWLAGPDFIEWAMLCRTHHHWLFAQSTPATWRDRFVSHFVLPLYKGVQNIDQLPEKEKEKLGVNQRDWRRLYLQHSRNLRAKRRQRNLRVYRSLDKTRSPLEKYRVKLFRKGRQNHPVSHTCMCGKQGLKPGNWWVPSTASDHREFLTAYVDDLRRGNPNYIVEKKTMQAFPLLIDLDFHLDRIIHPERMETFATAIHGALRRILPSDLEDDLWFIVLTRPPNIDGKKRWQSGYHLHFPRIIVNVPIALHLHNLLVRVMAEEFPDPSLKWYEIMDANVLMGTGLRPIGARKAIMKKDRTVWDIGRPYGLLSAYSEPPKRDKSITAMLRSDLFQLVSETSVRRFDVSIHPGLLEMCPENIPVPPKPKHGTSTKRKSTTTSELQELPSKSLMSIKRTLLMDRTLWPRGVLPPRFEMTDWKLDRAKNRIFVHTELTWCPWKRAEHRSSTIYFCISCTEPPPLHPQEEPIFWINCNCFCPKHKEGEGHGMQVAIETQKVMLFPEIMSLGSNPAKRRKLEAPTKTPIRSTTSMVERIADS